MSDRERLDALLEVLESNDLDALTVRVGETTYKLVRRAERPLVAAASLAENQEAVPAASGPAPSTNGGATVAAPANYKKVTAPIVGVFYRAPAPGAEPFVEPGDRVEVGQVLCILEAMKLMNEITSDYAGIVRRILPENGALVSLGEEMLWIEP